MLLHAALLLATSDISGGSLLILRQSPKLLSGGEVGAAAAAKATAKAPTVASLKDSSEIALTSARGTPG
eukprot:8979157-Pyramimonas_sp.AAC.1